MEVEVPRESCRPRRNPRDPIENRRNSGGPMVRQREGLLKVRQDLEPRVHRFVIETVREV